MTGPRILWTFLVVCFLWAVPEVKAQEAKQNISLEDIWQDFRFFPQGVPGLNFMKDGVHYAATEQVDGEQAVVKYNLLSGEPVEMLFDARLLTQLTGQENLRFNSYSFSPEENYMLIATERQSIYRYSSTAVYYVYNRETGALNALHNGARIMVPNICPVEKHIAFVESNNLFYASLEDLESVQVTTDGKTNEVINGSSDWVYEEEFSITRAHEWSEDGKHLAFIRFDESGVKEFTMSMYTNELYPEYVTFKYPKVGEDNALVSVHIFNVDNKTKMEVDFGEYEDFYIPRIQWTKDPNLLAITHMNRHQNHLKLYLADARNASKKMLYQETNKYFIDIHDNLKFTVDGAHFLWTSEQSGYNHIYLYDMEGRKVRAITSGNYDVTNLYGLDEENQQLFFQAAMENALEREIYRVNADGSGLTKLSPRAGTNSAQFSSTFDYFVLNYAAVETAPIYDVMGRNGEKLRNIRDNAEFMDLLNSYNLAPLEFMTIPTVDDVDMNAYIIKPPDFDENKTYPVLMYCYGGPGSQTVRNSWQGPNYFWFQMLAQQGIIVVSVDNRGTGGRGEEFKKMTYLELGHYETIDQIEAAKYLAQQPYVDADNIAIFGWSYGGYLSSLCILKGKEVFSAAIAVAPVTNWKWYDTIYTERYMRTLKENEDGYERNSPNNFAHLLEGDYLLVHGMGDDNVHLQHATEMANALINANKDFEWFAYPNRNHSIGGGVTRLHLYRMMTNFLHRSFDITVP